MHEFLHLFTEWLMQYGGIILFLLLALGIIGLPIPDEALLFTAGWLICKGKISMFWTPFAAFAGSITGITVSYLIGYYTGPWLVKKWGPKIRITEEKVQKVHNWFEKIGKWTLLIGYYVPVIRHLTGYVAGSSHLTYRQFAIFAYTGAIIWASTFLILGYFARNQVIHHFFHQ